MTKKLMIFLFSILFAGGLGYYLLDSQEGVFQSPPWKTSMEFRNVSDVQLDQHGSYYLIDQSLNRLSKTSAGGSYEFHVNLNDLHDQESLYLVKDYVIDEQGYIYVLALVLNSQGAYLEAEEILQFTPKGKLEDIIFQRKYLLSEKVTRPGRIHELNYQNKHIFFYEMSEKDILEEQEIVLNRLSLTSRDVEQVFKLTLPEETFVASLNGTELGSIYYSTKRAQIYKVDQLGTSNLIYASSSSDLVESYPVDIGDDQQQNVYFVDVGRGEINRLLAEDDYRKVEQVLTTEQLKNLGYAISLQSTDSIRINQDGSILLGVEDYLIHLDPNSGEIIQILAGATYKMKDILWNSLIWLGGFSVIALLIYALKLVYIDFLKDGRSILLKQIIIFTPIIVFLLVIISGVVYVQFLTEFDAEIKSKLKFLTHAGAQIADTERIDRITAYEDFMNEDFRAVYDRNQHMLKGNSDLEADALYSIIYRVDGDEQVRTLMLYNMSDGTLRPTPYLKPEYDLVINEGKIITKESQEVDGEWLYALGPIYREDGTLLGMQEVGMSMHNYTKMKDGIYLNIAQVILILIPIILMVFFVVSYIILSSIRKMRASVMEMADGNWDVRVEIRSKDEIGELGQQFNRMANQLGEYVQGMKDINASYYRFVPKQFLEFLGKKSILEVKLGDQIEAELVILVSSIRSFNVLSKGMTSAERYHYINTFYEVAGPMIRKHGGIINTYLSAGVMALFPQKAEQALLNALEMRQKLEEYSSDKHAPDSKKIAQFDLGVGIHKGPAMLGIVGEQERMEGHVISEDVNVSLLLEKHTKTLGASILLTSIVYEDIRTIKSYEYRYLGLVQLSEASAPLELYDVFEGDTESLRINKRITRERFEQGIAYYQAGRFYDARMAFIEVIKKNDQDQAAKLYFALCDEFFQKGVAKGWNGSLVLK